MLWQQCQLLGEAMHNYLEQKNDQKTKVKVITFNRLDEEDLKKQSGIFL